MKVVKRNIASSYEKYENETTFDIVDKSRYLKLNGLYNKFLINKVLDGHEVTLPARTGTLFIGGTKQKIKYDMQGKLKGLAPDWRRTKMLWDSNAKAKQEKRLVYHTNEHTDGIRYKYVWKKARCLIKNKTLYSLIMVRRNKRAVWKRILNKQEYPTVR